jgi:hypothetical protein
MGTDQPTIELRLAGYFPRSIVARPDWLTSLAVVDVCSVSDCVSPGPGDWVHLWLHNRFGFFNEPDLARRVIAHDDPPMRLFAYRISTVRFAAGRLETWAWPSDAQPVPPPPESVSLGFDAVSKYMDDVLGFGCSPLSCNRLADEWPVNSHCLLDDLDAAVKAAEQFSIEQPEPGVYYVAEILELPA